MACRVVLVTHIDTTSSHFFYISVWMCIRCGFEGMARQKLNKLLDRRQIYCEAGILVYIQKLPIQSRATLAKIDLRTSSLSFTKVREPQVVGS